MATRVSVADMQINPGTWVPEAPGWVRLRGHDLAAPRPHGVRWDDLVVFARDGVMWHDAPPPPANHEHVAQSYGVIGFTQFFRCACGAYADNGYPYWMVDDRTQRVGRPAPPVVEGPRRFLARIFGREG